MVPTSGGRTVVHRLQVSSTQRASSPRKPLLLTQLFVSATFWDRRWLSTSGELPEAGANPAFQFSNPRY